jgi:hypothetical protein
LNAPFERAGKLDRLARELVEERAELRCNAPEISLLEPSAFAQDAIEHGLARGRARNGAIERHPGGPGV